MLDFLAWLIFAATGRLLIYVWFMFPLRTKSPWLNKLHSCDLCAGTWVYTALAIALQADIFSPYFGVTANIVGEFATAVTTSFLVHVFAIGVREKFLSEPIVI